MIQPFIWISKSIIMSQKLFLAIRVVEQTWEKRVTTWQICTPLLVTLKLRKNGPTKRGENQWLQLKTKKRNIDCKYALIFSKRIFIIKGKSDIITHLCFSFKSFTTSARSWLWSSSESCNFKTWSPLYLVMYKRTWPPSIRRHFDLGTALWCLTIRNL
jgi:hypothetical protein